MRPTAAIAALFAPFALGALGGGCGLIDQLAPEQRFGDVVHLTNDEARWGRVDLAAQKVAPAHRASFVARHRRWGNDIQIADADVTNLELGLPEDRAASVVTYAGFDQRTMELQTTAVRQSWASAGESFVLIDETIIGGAPELFEEPAGDDDGVLASRFGDGVTAGGESASPLSED